MDYLMTEKIKESRFLREELRKRLENDMKDVDKGYDPRSAYKTALSSHWMPGDTIFTVSMRRIKNYFMKIIDPDTYTRENLQWLKEEIQMNKKIYLSAGLITLSPFIIILPYSINRALVARNKYLMHQLAKKRFLETSLGMKATRMRVKDLKNILKEDPLNH